MIFDIKIACGGVRAFPCEGRGGAGYTRTMFCSCFIHVARHRAVPPVKRDHLPGQCETEWYPVGKESSEDALLAV